MSMGSRTLVQILSLIQGLFGGSRSRGGEGVLFGDIFKELFSISETEILSIVFFAARCNVLA